MATINDKKRIYAPELPKRNVMGWATVAIVRNLSKARSMDVDTLIGNILSAGLKHIPEEHLVASPNIEKNASRRIADALNILKAINVVFREGRKYFWVGLPGDIEISDVLGYSGPGTTSHHETGKCSDNSLHNTQEARSLTLPEACDSLTWRSRDIFSLRQEADKLESELEEMREKAEKSKEYADSLERFLKDRPAASASNSPSGVINFPFTVVKSNGKLQLENMSDGSALRLVSSEKMEVFSDIDIIRMLNETRNTQKRKREPSLIEVIDEVYRERKQNLREADQIFPKDPLPTVNEKFPKEEHEKLPSLVFSQEELRELGILDEPQTDEDNPKILPRQKRPRISRREPTNESGEGHDGKREPKLKKCMKEVLTERREVTRVSSALPEAQNQGEEHIAGTANAEDMLFLPLL